MTKKETLTKLEDVTILEPGEKKPKIVARVEVTYCWDNYFDDWNLAEESERLLEVIRCHFLGRVTIINPARDNQITTN